MCLSAAAKSVGVVATLALSRGRDVNQVGCRLRYRSLREAGASEILRRLSQIARSRSR